MDDETHPSNVGRNALATWPWLVRDERAREIAGSSGGGERDVEVADSANFKIAAAVRRYRSGSRGRCSQLVARISLTLSGAIFFPACNAKSKACGAPAIAAVREKTGVDVTNDTQPEMKSARLAELTEKSLAAQSLVKEMSASDEAVARSLDTYKAALGDLVQKTGDLKAMFDEVFAASRQLEPLVAAEKTKKAAFSALLSEMTPKEMRRLANMLDGLTDSPADLERQATQLERMRYENTAANAAAATCAVTLRSKARLLKENEGLTARFARLETESELKRKSFSAARDTLDEADRQLASACGSK
jgi:hypothetical protein